MLSLHKNSVQQYLLKKANYLKKTRNFFDERNILEVQTPILQHQAVSDVYIDSIAVLVNSQIHTKPKTLFLHTSPELAMKSLLAKGSGSIYQICQTFRDNEQGLYNQNEFSLLEWYRLDFTLADLMDEVADFLSLFLANKPIIKLSYAQVFKQYLAIDIHTQTLTSLKKIAKQSGLNDDFSQIADLQMLLFVHHIEPKLSQYPICFIYDYPKTQNALSQVNNGISKRFEAYIYGIEVANGYQELTQAKHYLNCFEADKQLRHNLSRPNIDIDKQFLQDIKNGLPNCSGVALGLSRLFLILNKKSKV